MKVTLTLLLILTLCSVLAQSNPDEIKALQKSVRENEKAARLAEIDAKNKRYLLAATEMTFHAEDVREKELSTLLSVQAFIFNSQHGGYQYDFRIYQSLYNALRNYNRSIGLKDSSAIPSLKANRTSNSFILSNGLTITPESSGDLRFSRNGVTTRVLYGHKAQVDHIALSSSGLIVTSGKDNTIRVWNLSQINKRPIVITESETITALSFSSDGKEVLYSTRAQQLNVISLDMSEMAAELCKVITRNLTKEEWDIYVGGDLDYESACSKQPPNNK